MWPHLGDQHFNKKNFPYLGWLDQDNNKNHRYLAKQDHSKWKAIVNK